jgi:iron(II)-dependent oxidoreductase
VTAVPSTDAPVAGAIEHALDDARSRTLALLAPVPDRDQQRQVSALMSPLCWDLAHIGHYEELWLLRTLAGDAPTDELFDDVYDAFKHPRQERVSLPILDPSDARRYVAAVRERTRAVLRGYDAAALAAGADDPLLAEGFVYGMVVQHEHQHDETMLATLQLMDDFAHPDAGDPAEPRASTARTLSPDVAVPGGPFLMGAHDEPWAYDNERPAHEVTLAPYRIDTTPVTNAAYARFVAEGGYADERLWHPVGWAWCREAGLVAPGGWASDGASGWVRRRYGRTEAVPPDEPVQHVCWYEADAFARWSGARLPTEAEWERAAQGADARGANLWPVSGGAHRWAPGAVGSRPATTSDVGAHHMLGDVWEWTASSFRGHPGFRAFPYREYSEVFFGDEYKVLRGGSWATHPSAARPSFRNWDYPIRRQIFAGFRCARDA